MKEPQLNTLALQLLKKQTKEWPLAAANYAALAHVKTKTLSINGFNFVVQFNPARITSSAAPTDPQSIQSRPCFLCPHLLSPQQEQLPFTAQSGNPYMILCNPYPIFPQHLTIPDCHHTDQRISGRVDDMLELAEQLTDFVLFYNGSKSGASAPDHFHFQAGNKGFLPIQSLIESGASLTHYPAPALVFTTGQIDAAAAYLHQEPEPMLNLLCWKSEHTFYVVVFPRKQHRPSQFFATGDANILLTPGTIDLGGVLITPLEKDFCKLTAADVLDIFTQIS